MYFVNLNYVFKSQFQFLKTLSVIIFPYGIHGNQAISYQKKKKIAWNIYTQIHDMLKFFLRGFQFMVLAFDESFLL